MSRLGACVDSTLTWIGNNKLSSFLIVCVFAFIVSTWTLAAINADLKRQIDDMHHHNAETTTEHVTTTTTTLAPKPSDKTEPVVTTTTISSTTETSVTTTTLHPPAENTDNKSNVHGRRRRNA